MNNAGRFQNGKNKNKMNNKNKISKGIMSIFILSLMVVSIFAQSNNFETDQDFKKDIKFLKSDLKTKKGITCKAYWSGYEFDKNSKECIHKKASGCKNPFTYKSKEDCYNDNQMSDKPVSDTIVIGDNSEFQAYLTPKRMVAIPDSNVKYTLVIKDNNPQLVCVLTEGSECDLSITYTLEFFSRTIKADLQNEILLNPGEKKAIDFVVKSDKIGANNFIIKITSSDDTATKLKGSLLIREKVTIPPREGIYFQGIGSAVNDEESKYIALHILSPKDSKRLKGKMVFGTTKFLLSGKVLGVTEVAFGSSDGYIIRFDVIDPTINEPNSNQIGSIEGINNKVGEFNGILINDNVFPSIKGILEIYGDSYKLSVSSGQRNFNEDLILINSKKAKTKARINDLIVLREKLANVNSDDPINLGSEDYSESYIKPIRVRQARFLWIFPNPWGGKVLEFEHIEGSKITKKVIKERSFKKIGKYNLEVGSLDDDSDIEFTVSKT
jgi:hypothetical protein